MPTKEQVLEALTAVVDPEIMIDIVKLGLVYEVKIDEEKKSIDIDMTLTSPGFISIRQNDAKFFTSIARRNINFPNIFLNNASHFTQNLISRKMAIMIVV